MGSGASAASPPIAPRSRTGPCTCAGPVLGSLAADGAGRPDQRLLRREALDDARAALDLPVRALLHVVRPDAAAVHLGEVEVGEGVRLGPLHDPPGVR